MLMHPHRGAVDHLHVAVVSLGDCGQNAVPDPGFAPPHEAVVQVVRGPNSFGSARHGAPVRNTQKIPFSTRRSSTRGTPRGLFGSSGAITPHSKSVSSYPRIIKSSPSWEA